MPDLLSHVEPPDTDGCTAAVSPRAKVLLVPGLNDSPPQHWQSVWARERGDCERVDLGTWTDPQPRRWIRRLHRHIARHREPTIIVAHSLGCIAVTHWAAARFDKCRSTIKAALLVAPCDPETAASDILKRFAPWPRQHLKLRTILIASSNDPYAKKERLREMAATWGSEYVDIGHAGHINAQSGLGPWQFGQDLLNRIQAERWIEGDRGRLGGGTRYS